MSSTSAGDFIVDVHGDPENADLQQSDAKQTPQYRVHRRYRLPPSARARAIPDDTRSGKRYFFAFAADRSGADIHVVKPGSGSGEDETVPEEFVPIAGAPLDQANGDIEASWVTNSRKLNERCRLQPGDIDAWWSLIQLQDTVPGLTKAARLEKKVAILEAAVAANPSCDPLWLALVRYGGEAGADTDPIWERALRASASALMVERYVRAALSSFSQFSIGSIRSRMQSLLARLTIVAGKLHVLSLWAWVERRAGYDERATAMAQAALEFHLFCPNALRAAPIAARLDAFEQFWESEVPRVGEPSAPTWAGWYGSGGLGAAVAPVADPPPSPLTLRSWFDREASCCRRLPLRGGDDDDDLERIVIFDDLRPALFDAGEGAVVHFVDELLVALGVADDCLTRTRLVANGDDAVVCRLIDLDDAFHCDRSAFLTGVADAYRARVRPQQDDVVVNAALAALDQVLGSGRLGPERRDALRLTRARVQARYSGPDPARRYLKAELRRDRANLELAAVLAQLAEPDAADPIFAALLGSMPAPWAPPVYCLAWAAVQNALEAERDPRPWLVQAAAGGGPAATVAVSAIAVSQARRSLQALIGRLGTTAAWWRLPFGSVFGASPGLSVALVGIHLEYAGAGASDGDLGAALAYFEGVVRPILPEGGGPQAEFVWGRVADLVRRHAQRHPASCPPRLTRAVFEPALASCPLALPIWGALIVTAPNAGAVRTQFDACMGRMRRNGLLDVPIRLLLGAIVFELAQPTATVSGRVHRLFEQAVLENGRGVDLLWRLYLRFELHRGAVDAARKVLYRAVDQCPGSRDIWLDSIRALIAAVPATGPGALKDNDLLELVTLMGEKGVRLHSQPPPI